VILCGKPHFFDCKNSFFLSFIKCFGEKKAKTVVTAAEFFRFHMANAEEQQTLR
jgi:hypothetical protein